MVPRTRLRSRQRVEMRSSRTVTRAGSDSVKPIGPVRGEIVAGIESP